MQADCAIEFQKLMFSGRKSGVPRGCSYITPDDLERREALRVALINCESRGNQGKYVGNGSPRSEIDISNQNRVEKTTCASGFWGVYFDKRRNNWRARIAVGGDIPLGCFPTAREAALAYDMAARCLGVSFAYLNFPPEESDHVQLSDRVLKRINDVLHGVMQSMAAREAA